MARDDWRLRIVLTEPERKGLLGRLHLWESDARELAHELKERRLAVTEQDGYGVVRRFRFVIAGCASREEAEALARRLHGEVEAGGELVWETMPGNPFAVFGGIGDSGGPI